MKTFISYLFSTPFCLFLVIASPLVQAESLQIPEVDSADFAELAEGAEAENKQLMVVYYRNQCNACKELTSTQNNKELLLNDMAQHYKIYKTNVASSFNVACPSGEILSEDEFLSVKGITSFPAIVITDQYGSVEVVENGITTVDQLLAIGDLFKTQKIAKITRVKHLN